MYRNGTLADFEVFFDPAYGPTNYTHWTLPSTVDMYTIQYTVVSASPTPSVSPVRLI